MILVLDDNIFRHKTIRGRVDAVIDSAFTYTQAVGLLGKTKYDTIYLDHDLGDFHTPDKKIEGGVAKEFTGYDVCLWMVENDIDCPEIIIQSVNPVGAKRMLDYLSQFYPKVYWQPFQYEDEDED
jgi:hypothetical protein